MLGAALIGIEDELPPPAPITGNAYEIRGVPRLCESWDQAVGRIESDPLIARILSKPLIDNLVMTKRQEIERFAQIPSERHWFSYLEAV